MTRRVVRLLLAAALACWSQDAWANDRPVVFLHGLNGSASYWAGPASRMQQSAAIQPGIPSLDWRLEFGEQARRVQANAQFGGLPDSSVAIGHSNGGLVAREWSKQHRLGGLVTIGTPHGGAPILLNLYQWGLFSDITRWGVDRLLSAFSVPTDWWWIITLVEDSLRFSRNFSVFSVVELAGVLGVKAVVPVTEQMLPGSGFLNSLNSDGNLAREAGAVSKRIGIVSVAHNYFFAGPARAAKPDDADAIAVALYGSAGALIALGNLTLAQSSPANWAAFEQAMSLIGLGYQLLMIDPMYCHLVTHPFLSICMPNDGVVPIDRQTYPGAAYVRIEGPAHTQQRDSDDVLYHAMVNYVGVPPRVGAPAPGPLPAPIDPADPDDPSDPGVPHEPIEISSGALQPDELLRPGDVVYSTNRRVHLAFQADGNLVLYDEHGQPLWASGTDDESAGVVAMQGDGNLVMYDAAGVPRWASDTAGHSGAWLAVQDDGNVVIYAGGRAIWATGTVIN